MDSLKTSSDNYMQIDQISEYRDSSFNTFFDHIQVGMAIVDIEGICFKVNSKLCELLGYSEPELLGYGFKKIVFPEEEEYNLFFSNKIFSDNPELQNEEKHCLRKDGIPIWVTISNSLAVDNESKPLYFVFQIEDITRRKKAEMALGDSEKKFEFIFENVIDGICINEPGGKFLEVNRITCEKLGYSREEMLQKTATELVSSDSSKLFAKKARELYQFGHTIVEVEAVCKDGTCIPVEISLTLFEYKRRPAILSIVRDITERKKVERMLEYERNCAQNYLDIAGTIILAIDSEQKITLINKKGSEFLGFPKEDIVGKNWFETFVPESCRQKVKDNYMRLISENCELSDNFENVVLTKGREVRIVKWHNTTLKDESGKIIGTLSSGEDITERTKIEKEMKVRNAAMDSALNPIVICDLKGHLKYVNSAFLRTWEYSEESEVLGNQIESFLYSENESDVIKELFSHGAWAGELTARGKDYKQFPVYLSANFVKDGAGNPICMMGSFLDVSKIKETEMLMNEARIKAEEASRLKSYFLASVSHELRTPLNSIIGFADLLKEKTFGPLNEKQFKQISNISTSGKHLLKLIDDILDLSKIETGNIDIHPEEFSLLDMFEEIKGTFAPLASKKRIRIEIEFASEIKKVKADRTKFKQILYNLIDNATKFTPEEGLIKVDARISGKYIIISVLDSGPGIPLYDQKKLFEPFTQLGRFESREQSGTGLGLAIVKNYVDMHKGKVWVESKSGEGCKFIFTIPQNLK